MKEKFKKAYMQTAMTFAELSHARRLHVGAIVVKDDRIISIGYNGMPAGWDNDCEEKIYKIDGYLVDDEGCYELRTKSEVLHAEANAITKLAKSAESGQGADIFITHAPCIQCAKLIYQSGIKKVYFGKAYRDTAGIEFLEKCNVPVENLNV